MRDYIFASILPAFFIMKTNYKRSLIDGEVIYGPKRSKHEELKAMQRVYGDGVVWSRGVMIGKGSFGCVFKAILKNPNSRFSLYPSIMAVKSVEVSSSGSIWIEKQVMDNIGSCSSVFKCFGEEITKGGNHEVVHNLLLEYASGGTLADLIKSSNGEGFPESDVKRYARSILRGLSHIHKKGYVHCDLKTENVMLVDNGKNSGFIAKIGNLGSAKRKKSKKTKNKLGPFWRGTPVYSSLKAEINGVQEQTTDIWAVGCILFQMLTGKPLWSSNKDSNIDEILSSIGDESDSPLFSSSLSREAMNFLKDCLCRKFTADTLLPHTFLEGLGEDDASQKEVLDIKDITTSTSFSDDDDDDDDDNDELWLSSYSNGSSRLKGVLTPWKSNKAQMPDTVKCT